MDGRDPRRREREQIVTGFSLTHLTFIGPGVQTASVEFGEGLTLIRGPSDTGKSFIVEAIDFVLGAQRLQEIPQSSRYATVLLGLAVDGDSRLTLARDTKGGSVYLYRRDLRSGPLPEADERLSPKHSSTKSENVSQFMLAGSGLTGKLVRKNVRSETDALSFRNVLHLSLIDETAMQSRTPSPFTGRNIEITKEKSVLKLLIEGEDDSGLTATADPETTKQIGKAQLRVVDDLLDDLAHRLRESPSVEVARSQLAMLNEAIQGSTASVEALVGDRHDAVQQLTVSQAATAESDTSLNVLGSLRDRFDLLRSQYESDLDRLELIAEAGSLLGYFTPGDCPFCGADVDHQHPEPPEDGDNTNFGHAVESEIAKTQTLRSDLLLAIEDLEADVQTAEHARSQTRSVSEDLRRRIRTIDEQLFQARDSMNELIEARSDIEHMIGLHEQVSLIEQRRASLTAAPTTASTAEPVAADRAASRRFSTEIALRLQAWGVPDGDLAYFDRNEWDVVAGDQVRRGHGKGVRAILHAAFTVALAQHCSKSSIGHPGFVVLDSPLITYRAPDASGAEDSNEPEDVALDAEVADRFYADLQTLSCQVIVMENTDPGSPLPDGSVDIQFTKSEAEGRYGFFPRS